MSNLDKTVKLACKPKNAPPKAKYVDVLVAATFSDDGSLQDICRSLSLRMREPNAVVVFKALLVLHQMIRSGSTDSLLDFLGQGDALRLRNISGQNWDGYNPPSSLGYYAQYLDSRIKAYRDLKHDLVQVQTESNRRSNGLGANSKARRLRHLPVEKGLLREVKQVQKILDALIQCRFYDDDLREENTVLAFRMLVKDLLVLFQAGNEGVCNILEHYFEMSKVDATDAFQIYKSFIKQTDKVVDYLNVARKLHNIVNVPVPNLKHAPTGLVKALEEYLNDPNFEQNRREYKSSLGVVEGKAPRTPSPNPTSSQPKEVLPNPAAASASSQAAPSTTAPAAPPGSSQKIQDFFDSIQPNNQPTMFGGPAQSLGYSQMAQFNPFRQSMMMPQQTGMGFMQPQMTGFPNQFGSMGHAGMQPQMTGAMAFGAGASGNRQTMFMGDFGQPQSAPPSTTQPLQQQQQSMQTQPTGFIQPQPMQAQTTGFLQPHATGSNPFRQSMMFGTSSIGPSGQTALSQPSSPFQPSTQPFGSQIQRPGSTPAFVTAGLHPKPLQPQATGSKNPFAPAGGVPSPAPKSDKGPSMNELALGAFRNQQQHQSTGFPTQPSGSAWNSLNGQSSSTVQSSAPGGSGSGSAMADIASAFALDSKSSPSGTNDFMSQFGSMSVSATGTSNASTTTGATSPSAFSSTGGLQPQSTGFLQPQQTGFGGSNIKRFQPTSSFGSQLMETLPPLPENGPAQSPAATSPGTSNGLTGQATGFPFATNGQPGQPGHPGGPGGSGTGSFLQPQSTGGAPNPFRQSMFGQPTGSGAFGVGSPFVGQNRPQMTGTGAGAFGQQPTGQFGGMGMFGQQQTGQQPQQAAGTGMGSLI